MKKTEMILFVSACLFSAPASSTDIDETQTARRIKIKPCKNQENSLIEGTTGWYNVNNKISIKNNDNKDFEGNVRTSKAKKEIDQRICKLDLFYNEWNETTCKARNKDNNFIKKVINLKPKNNKEKEKLARKVRVPAIKAAGSARRVGLDEFFQTAETPYFAMCDAGLVKGKKPSSPLKSGKTFGWLDAQHYVRVPTSEPIYKDKKGNIIGGHAGALYKNPSPRSGWVLGGQKKAHDERQEVIERSSTPGNAVVRALRSHLESTASRKDYERKSSFSAYDTKNRDLSKPKNWDAFKWERLKGRDNVKCALHVFERNLQEDSDASSLSSYETSSCDFIYSQSEDLVIDDIRDILNFLLVESGE